MLSTAAYRAFSSQASAPGCSSTARIDRAVCRSPSSTPPIPEPTSTHRRPRTSASNNSARRRASIRVDKSTVARSLASPYALLISVGSWLGPMGSIRLSTSTSDCRRRRTRTSTRSRVQGGLWRESVDRGHSRRDKRLEKGMGTRRAQQGAIDSFRPSGGDNRDRHSAVGSGGTVAPSSARLSRCIRTMSRAL
jgi:hypothetical protein